MTTKLRVAAIGVGHLGRHHARIYSQHESVELVAVVDTNPEQAAAIAREYGTPALPDYRQLIGKVDAVSIATPTATHYELGRFFLQQGIHVLLEKPIATSVPQAEELVEISRRNHLVLQIGHLERFNAAVVEAAKLIDKPGFIEAQRLGAFSPRSLDVDVIHDLMIHDIDIILSLVKSPVRSIHAVGVPVLTNKVDIANARLVFESGCVANMTASRVSFEPVRKIRIFQPDLYISLDYAQQNLFSCRKVAPESGNQLFPRIEKHPIPVEKVEPLKAEIDAFLACIRGGTAPVVPGEDGLAALRIADAISKQF
jgi:predicted dehydrogenase